MVAFGFSLSCLNLRELRLVLKITSGFFPSLTDIGFTMRAFGWFPATVVSMHAAAGNDWRLSPTMSSATATSFSAESTLPIFFESSSLPIWPLITGPNSTPTANDTPLATARPRE
jgi:hypothetical protein